MLIKRHEQCIGISLPSLGRFKLECWYCPSGYKIKPHSHDNIDIELLFLSGGGTTIHRKEFSELFSESHKLHWLRDFGRRFTIKAGTVHWFNVSKWPLIFINFEWWKKGIKPTSASIDFKEKI